MANNKITIEPQKDTDAEEFFRITNQNFPFFHAPPADMNAQREILQKHQRQAAEGTGYHFGIWCEHKLVGGVGAAKKDDGWHAGYFVDEAYQRQGIAPRAFSMLEEILAKKGITNFKLHIHDDNEGSKRVAQKLGYVQGDKKPITLRGGTEGPGHYWVKN